MSIVLYALGAGLLAWSGFLMLSGESYAAIDIAANLAGWGVFAIGLGAVTGALHKLTKTIARGRQPGRAEPARSARAEKTPKVSKARQDEADVLPMFVARNDEPAHFERAPAPAEPPAPEPVVAVPEPVDPQPVVEKPAPVAPPPPPKTAVQPPAPEPARKERRAMRLRLRNREEPTIAPPPVAAPALGGGLFARRGDREEPKAALVAAVAPEVTIAPEPAPAEEKPAPSIMSGRRALPRAATIDEISPKEPEQPVEAVADVAPEPEPRPEPLAPVDATPEEDVKLEAAERETPAEVQPEDAAQVEAAALEPEPQPEPEPEPEPEREPQPQPARAATPAPEPKVPDWLARARARRQARMDEPSDAGAPRFVRNGPEPEPEDFAEPPAPADEPAPQPEPVFEPSSLAEDAPQPEPRPEIAAAPELEPDIAAEAAPEPEPAAEPAPGRRVMSEGEHNGVTYRFFEDGGVEAESPHGIRSFGSVEELQSAVAGARARGGRVEDAAPAPAHDPEAVDPFEAALAELEGTANAPEVRIAPDDRRSGGR